MKSWLKTLFKTKLTATLVVSVASAWALDAQQIFERVSPSVVVIKSGDSMGSGVVYSVDNSGLTPSTTILTNCHVVQGQTQVTVERLGKKASAIVKVCDPDRDMAIVTLGGTLPTLSVRSTALKVGEPAFAVGAPQGLELSISQGIVSQLRPNPLGKDPMIQTTAAISQGSSGGGLFDSEGRLIGLTTLYYKEGQALNFAVPVSFVRSLQHSPTARQTDLPKQADQNRIVDGYELLPNGIARSLVTGLEWQRCSVGQSWTGSSCGGEVRNFTFEQIQHLARSGWRMPTVRELHSLVWCSSGQTKHSDDPKDGGPPLKNWCVGNYQRPTILQHVFPGATQYTYWTASPFVGGSSYAWGVNFHHGTVAGNGVNDGHVRLVR